MKNKYIKIIQTKKYKDINLYLRFSLENKPLYKEKLLLLTKLIANISNKYPDKVSMSKARDMLYGIGLDVGYKSRLNIVNLSLHYSFINPKFVDATIQEYKDYILETLNNSIINEATLKEAKNSVIASIKRSLEKPNTYAISRFNKIVSKDNPYFDNSCLDLDTIKNIKKIDVKDLISFYKLIINKAQLNIYLCGDIDTKTINTLTSFDFDNRLVVKPKYKKINYPHLKTIKDNKKMSQSVLYSVYSTPFNKKHKDFFAWFVGNVFLGVVPTSLLFSEVREKLSLCYSIGVIDYKNDGLVRIATYIDADKQDVVLNQIDKQINRIINKDYDLDKLEMSKALLANSLLSTYDELDALIDYEYESFLTDFNYSLEEYINNILKVSADDIANLFKQYKPYFNYILVGKENA